MCARALWTKSSHTRTWDLKTRAIRLYTGLARTIYIRSIYGIFGREITKYSVIYGVYIRFWPTLLIYTVDLHWRLNSIAEVRRYLHLHWWLNSIAEVRRYLHLHWWLNSIAEVRRYLHLHWWLNSIAEVRIYICIGGYFQ